MILFVLSKEIIMKKLINVSPFILLLIPVFVIALFTMIPMSSGNQSNNEVALKTSSGTSVANVLTNLAK
jgi:hypothetical protein